MTAHSSALTASAPCIEPIIAILHLEAYVCTGEPAQHLPSDCFAMTHRIRPDYKTDHIPVGRSWTTLDTAMSKTAHSTAIWTTLDDFGQRAACSKTAGCRCDS